MNQWMKWKRKRKRSSVREMFSCWKVSSYDSQTLSKINCFFIWNIYWTATNVSKIRTSVSHWLSTLTKNDISLQNSKVIHTFVAVHAGPSSRTYTETRHWVAFCSRVTSARLSTNWTNKTRNKTISATPIIKHHVKSHDSNSCRSTTTEPLTISV